jgi:hypothetical protein
MEAGVVTVFVGATSTEQGGEGGQDEKRFHGLHGSRASTVNNGTGFVKWKTGRILREMRPAHVCACRSCVIPARTSLMK